MEKIVIRGGFPLDGTVRISGSKKSILTLIPATLLANDPCMIENVPRIKDVRKYISFLAELGISSVFKDSTLVIDPRGINSNILSKKHDSFVPTIYLIGAMIGRYRECSFVEPCFSIEKHLKGFQALGAKIEHKDGRFFVSAPRLTGTMIYLDTSDVEVTLNIILLAVCAEGITTIKNAAKDPEVVDLVTFLSSMGAEVRGAGTSTIRIKGVRELSGCVHTIIPDRIEAGIYLTLAAATHGKIEIDQMIPKHLKAILAKVNELGVEVKETEESVVVSGKKHYTSIDIQTLPYPGFPPDLQQPFLTLLTQAKGTSLITEHISSSRFQFATSLKKMGANIKVTGRTAIVEGVTPLKGQHIPINDHSSGVALLIAGLIAQNQTVLLGTEGLESNFDHLFEKLVDLGANIQKTYG